MAGFEPRPQRLRAVGQNIGEKEKKRAPHAAEAKRAINLSFSVRAQRPVAVPHSHTHPPSFSAVVVLLHVLECDEEGWCGKE